MGGFADIINRAAQAGVNKIENDLQTNPNAIPPASSVPPEQVQQSLSNLQAFKQDMAAKGTLTPVAQTQLDASIKEYQAASGTAAALGLLKKYWWVGAVWIVVLGVIVLVIPKKKK